MSMSSAPGSAAGFSIHQARPDAPIIGSTGMHMRLAASAEDVVLNAEGSGYTMPFPAPGMYAQMQSNMAATLNIDWLLDLARELLASEGVSRSRNDLLTGLDDRILDRPPAVCSSIPISRRPASGDRFSTPSARAQFTGLESGMGFADLMRAVFEGLCLAARDCYAAMGTFPPRCG